MEDRENRSQLRCGIKLQFSIGTLKFPEKSVDRKVGEGRRKGRFKSTSERLGVRISARGFSLRMVLCRLRKSFIVKMESETYK